MFSKIVAHSSIMGIVRLIIRLTIYYNDIRFVNAFICLRLNSQSHFIENHKICNNRPITAFWGICKTKFFYNFWIFNYTTSAFFFIIHTFKRYKQLISFMKLWLWELFIQVNINSPQSLHKYFDFIRKWDNKS